MASRALAISTFHDVTVVTFRDSMILDTLVVEDIARDLYQLVDGEARRKIVLDFAAVRFLSSSMIGALLALTKKSAAIKGEVVLCGLQKNIHDVFRVANLHKILRIVDNESVAFKKLGVHL